MARIVIDARISGTTTGRYVDKLVEYLHKLNPPHEFIVLTRPHRIEYLQQIAPRFTISKSDYADFSFGEQLGFAKQLYSLNADLVHFPMVQQPILYSKPKVTSMLDLTTIRFRDPLKNSVIFGFKQQVYMCVNWLAAKTSRHIIAISQFVATDIAKTFHVPQNKITVTHNAADPITNKPKKMPGIVGKQFIFYTGRPQPHKNLKRLIDAFMLVRQQHPELLLVLGGKTDALYEDLQKYAAEKNAEGVVFTGFVSEGQLRWLYENAKAYIFPSLSEGFGLPGLEAMQYDLPVVSSNATCLPEIYKDAALYFDPLDTQDIAVKISQILDNDRLAKELAQKGNKLVKTYSWERLAQQTLEVYNNALK